MGWPPLCYRIGASVSCYLLPGLRTTYFSSRVLVCSSLISDCMLSTWSSSFLMVYNSCCFSSKSAASAECFLSRVWHLTKLRNRMNAFLTTHILNHDVICRIPCPDTCKVDGGKNFAHCPGIWLYWKPTITIFVLKHLYPAFLVTEAIQGSLQTRGQNSSKLN